MDTGKILLTGGALAIVVIASLAQGRSDAKVDRLAIRVDSLAVSLGQVVETVEASQPTP